MASEEVDVFKSYDPLLPCQNKKVQELSDIAAFKKHKDAVDAAATVLDTKQPRVYIHQHLKLKKLQLEEERLATIERDNRLLLERIAKIMRTTGSIDNNNMDREVKSLSIERRQRELLRITQENKQVLGRIMARKTKSDYSRDNWEPKWKREEYYMAQLSRFQPVKGTKSKSESGSAGASRDNKEDAAPQQQKRTSGNKKEKQGNSQNDMQQQRD